LLHGYGAGLGFFYRNFPALGSWAASRRTPVYALDWLGMGRSSRPPFRIHAKREDTAGRVHEAESFFIDALEEWRQEMRMEKMTLIGHSLGGYLSVAYALRFPNRVGKIILLSPAGVPSDPNTSEAPARELDPTPTEPTGSGKSTALGGSKERASSIHSEQAKQKRQESRSRRLFTYLWEEGWSPFQVVRSSLMFAPLLVGKVRVYELCIRAILTRLKYSTRRFTGLTEQETQDMHEYILNITLAKGSGEYSICE
jgi:cardiolipin-specific phospholipase